MEMQKTVLLVEDDKSFRESVRKLLEKEGMRVLEASSGEEGIEMLTSDRAIDLVLLDLYLGGISGMEFLDKTRELERPPVIMITAFGDWGIHEDAVSKGAVDCIPKPVKKQDLVGMVHKVFEESKCA